MIPDADCVGFDKGSIYSDLQSAAGYLGLARVEWRTAGGIRSLFFGTFLLVLTKYLFWQVAWALGYHAMKFRYFPIIS